jgi:leukotriene-A4 hydrolase
MASRKETSPQLSAGKPLVRSSKPSLSIHPLEVFLTNLLTEDSVSRYGADHEFTKLIIDHNGIDPDDAFSTVPYEKGYHFLNYLEILVGREAFDKFIPHYFSTWAEKSLDSFQFKETFLNFFNGLGDGSIKEKVASIDWDTWFYKPGLPPKPKFDTSLADVCYSLAEKWKDPVC